MKLGYLFKEGVKNAWSNRTMTIASIAVLVSCLLLTGSAVLFSMNLAKAMEVFQGGNSIQVYLCLLYTSNYCRGIATNGSDSHSRYRNRN